MSRFEVPEGWTVQAFRFERLLCEDPAIAYNDVEAWNYTALPHALGCEDWFTARATTCGELDAALATAGSGDQAAYVEVVTGTYAAPELPNNLRASMSTLYHLG